MNPGERIAIIGMFLWMCFKVGPWWIGFLILIIGFISNLLLTSNDKSKSSNSLEREG